MLLTSRVPENTTLELKVLWRVRNRIREKNARDSVVRKAER